MSGVRVAALAPASGPVLFLDIDGVICMGKPHGCFAAAAAVNDRQCTPSKFGRSRRVHEIAEWLDRQHAGEAFAILDDTGSGASLAPALTPPPPPPAPSNVPAARHSGNEAPHPFAGRVTLCEENVGVTSDHVPFILAALRRAVPVARVAA